LFYVLRADLKTTNETERQVCMNYSVGHIASRVNQEKVQQMIWQRN